MKQVHNMYLYKTTLVLLCGLSAGCALTTLPQNVEHTVRQTESAIDNDNIQFNHSNSKAQNNFIAHLSTGYLGTQIIASNTTDFLPPVFNNRIQIYQQFSSLKSIADTLTELTLIPTSIEVTNTNQNLNECRNIRLVQKDGNLIDLLNLISARCDLTWNYYAGKIIIADTQTKTWNIQNIPGDIQVQNQINNTTGLSAQSSGGAGGSATGGGVSQTQSQTNSIQNISFNLQNSLWTNLYDGVKNLLSKTGTFTVSPSTSSITVTDKPSIINRVNTYIDIQNAIMSQQVQIDVQVLSVDVAATDNYGINWGLALNGSNATFSINGQAVAAGQSGSNNFVPTPIFVPTTTTQAFTIGSNSGSLSGSQLIINALSTVAKTSLLTSAAVTTLSNQPVPIQFVDQLSYLASVSVTQTLQVGSQTALTPGQLTTGFSLNILPVRNLCILEI